ncbi:NUDIX hydrolase [Haloechinothrix sp. LS1_15]|uniref:NUDIX hydrolase n=1 Tax=Haloechinothrix sp. LS1_15 TaxID=2652248 RepID=UPI002944430D|nr:NUDIX hydrolase [Haloechinothrix sp. LS1_15]MDV6010993.1 NUDIX hydrolase [Haloechinothrix sp. LS1_15]
MPSSAGHSGAASSGRRSRRHRRRRMITVNETSAGGLVVDQDRTHVVLIGRLDRSGSLLWSLPKGHIEEGESREQTAVREVKEETGISARVLESLGTIDYWFVADRKRVHKTVHHFLLEATGGELSNADSEVTDVAWVPFGELAGVLAYADERKLAAKAQEVLAVRYR